MAELRSYGTLLDASTAIYVRMPKYSEPKDFATSSDWTPAAGDVKVSKDGGAAANITNLPTYIASMGAWQFILTATELTCKQCVVSIIDSATKAVVDNGFTVETVGNASSMWPDPSTSNPVPANIVQVSGDATAADNLEADYDGTGYAKTNSTTGLIANAVDTTTLSTDAATEIRDSVWGYGMTEPVSPPTVTGSVGEALAWLFALAKNKITQTSTTTTLRNAADSANIATSTVSDDGSTFTRSSWS